MKSVYTKNEQKANGKCVHLSIVGWEKGVIEMPPMPSVMTLAIFCSSGKHAHYILPSLYILTL